MEKEEAFVKLNTNISAICAKYGVPSYVEEDIKNAVNECEQEVL
jgi:hypothetical protein